MTCIALMLGAPLLRRLAFLMQINVLNGLLWVHNQ